MCTRLQDVVDDENHPGQAFQRAMCNDLNQTVEAAFPSFRVIKKRSDEEEEDIRNRWDSSFEERFARQEYTDLTSGGINNSEHELCGNSYLFPVQLRSIRRLQSFDRAFAQQC